MKRGKPLNATFKRRTTEGKLTAFEQVCEWNDLIGKQEGAYGLNCLKGGVAN